jgi:ribosomal protein S18 acetylase RimI-like enzyme
MTEPRQPSIQSQEIVTQLETGLRVCVRAMSGDDRTLLCEGIEKLSAQSRYLRFFSAAPRLPSEVIDRLVDIDHEEHLAWGAIDLDSAGKPAIGAVHAIQSGSDDAHEFSIAVLDRYHGQGVGTLLTAVILLHCQAAGIDRLKALTLAENRSAIHLLKSLKAERTGSDRAVSHYELGVDAALDGLLQSNPSTALRDVAAHLRPYA